MLIRAHPWLIPRLFVALVELTAHPVFHAGGVVVSSRAVEEALRRHPRKASGQNLQSSGLLVAPRAALCSAVAKKSKTTPPVLENGSRSESTGN